jgi:type III restriction enzyme
VQSYHRRHHQEARLREHDQSRARPVQSDRLDVARPLQHVAGRYETSADRCHVNYVVLDSDWEAEFCRVAERHPKVNAYVKNHSLGLAKEKKSTMDAYWIPGVNNLRTMGRWAFAELRDIYRIGSDLEAQISSALDSAIAGSSEPRQASA